MTDKAKDDVNDLASTFDDVDSGWTIKDCRKTLQNAAAGKLVQWHFGDPCREQCCQCQWNW
jgi:hypothetical protein